MPRKKLIKPQYITSKLMLILPFFLKKEHFFLLLMNFKYMPITAKMNPITTTRITGNRRSFDVLPSACFSLNQKKMAKISINQTLS